MPLCTILTKCPAPLVPVQIALFGGAADLLTPRRARDVAHPGRQRLENRIEALHRLIRAADHQAVATLQAHHAAARPAVDVVDLLGREFPGPANVVHVVGVAAVYEDVAGLEMGQNVGDELFHKRSRNHHPDRPRILQLLHEVRERGSPNGLLLRQLLYRFGRPIEDHALMASLEKTPHHVRAHSSKTDHAKLHNYLLFRLDCFTIGFRSLPG